MSNVRSITPNEPADFTPVLGNYKTLQPFRYWCQKVLPLVYDDSLSYYELLCKVVDYLNKTMEDVEMLHGDVNKLHTAYKKLQSYVNNYFSTLDVQKEINNKLDQMFSEGLFDDIINNHLTSGYINVVASGAKNNGEPTGAILNGIFNKYPNATFYFPHGTYTLETSLELFNDNVWSILFDGATIIASANLSSMIHISTKKSTNEKHPPKISGTGVIDMNNLAETGILVENQSRYLKICDINVENIGNGIGIQLGTENGASMSSILNNICVRGTSSENLSSIGVLVHGYDIYFDNVNIIRCYGGLRLLSGGNMVNNVHIWSDLQPTHQNWGSSYGIYNGFIDNMLNNIYLDNCAIGVYCIQPTICNNIYYYLPYTGSGQKAVIFRTAQNNIVKCQGLYVVKKSGYETDILLIANRTQEYQCMGTKSFIINSNVYDVTGFTIVSECFNLRNNKFNTTLAKNLQNNSYKESTYLVGYLSKTTGVGVLKLKYGGAFSYNIKIASERVKNLEVGNITAELESGLSSSGKEKLIIGNAVDMGELTCYPIYMSFDNGFVGLLGVDFDSIGELGFYLNSHLNISDCAYTGTISKLIEIDL